MAWDLDDSSVLRDWGVRLDPGRPYMSYGEEGYRVVMHDEELAVFGEFRVPKNFWFLSGTPTRDAIDPDWPHSHGVWVTMRLGPERGEIVCRSLLIQAPSWKPALTTSNLRLPLAELIRVAAVQVGLAVDQSRSGQTLFPVTASNRARGGFLDVYDSSLMRRGKRLPDAHLKRVADVYREALAKREPPTATVAKTMHTARSNAGRWVMEARRRGFLGPAAGAGLPGELDHEGEGNG